MFQLNKESYFGVRNTCETVQTLKRVKMEFFSLNSIFFRYQVLYKKQVLMLDFLFYTSNYKHIKIWAKFFTNRTFFFSFAV
jgi:hypothetical protein